MPAALQCPDCGHQEMLDHLGGVSTFRCGGCGRALKVPAQFRNDAPPDGGRQGLRPDATQALPRVPPAAAAAAVGAATPPVGPVPGGVANPGVPTARTPVADAGIDGVGGAALPPGGSGGPGDPVGAPVPKAPIDPESLKPPLILRLVLWAIALPLGSLIVFAMASAFGVLTKAQLEDTFLRADWGRFVPIARLLPFCALATALLVQLGVFLLERLRARNLSAGPRRRGGRGGPGGARPGPTRPHAPRGPAQRATNGGGRTRDRVTS